MVKYLVAYQLSPDEDSAFPIDSIPNAIYNIDENATFLFNYVWILASNLTASEIKDKLSRFLTANEQLLVTTVNADDLELVGFTFEAANYLKDKV